MTNREGFALLQRIGAHGVEVALSDGRHFCIPRANWDRIVYECWAEVFDDWVLYGAGGLPQMEHLVATNVEEVLRG